MKISAAVLALLAVLIGVVPFFYNCQHDGKALTLANGREVPMKCYWTARAALAVAVPLLAVALFLALSQQRETRRALSVLGAILGGLTVLLPTRLIGVCQHAGASCNLVMKPTLILAGVLVIVIALASLVAVERRPAETV
jgi:hypothetical protein